MSNVLNPGQLIWFLGSSAKLTGTTVRQGLRLPGFTATTTPSPWNRPYRFWLLASNVVNEANNASSGVGEREKTDQQKCCQSLSKEKERRDASHQRKSAIFTTRQHPTCGSFANHQCFLWHIHGFGTGPTTANVCGC